MKSFIDIEKRLGGKLYQGEGDIIIPGGMETPLTYRRTEQGIPDLLVTYTFSKVDSLVHSIDYEWDMINFDRTKKKQPLNVQKAFIKKYQSLADQISTKHGNSEKKGELSDLTKIDLKAGLKRSDEWKPNDSSSVSLYAVFSNYSEEKENIKIQPTNRIWLYVTKVKKPTNPELSAKSIQAAKKSYDQFILKLRAGELENAKAFISPQIRSQVTQTVFDQFKTTIKPEAFRVYTESLQQVNGVDYLMIQYAYESASEDPKEVIRVLFDKENLIIGIQPRTMK
ncbi:hypothetical protein [Pedobacter gandavensis]|uniref:hypothetical protein n=1 Tax=Pedobacter gandavensis TaxID=2679963 RepID=UPI00292DAF79|nr:hypothetical protein [Pedobacter gandavensis]